jgi:hypothetical protein
LFLKDDQKEIWEPLINGVVEVVRILNPGPKKSTKPEKKT